MLELSFQRALVCRKEKMATTEADDTRQGESKKIIENRYADWMGKLPLHLLDTPLHKLSIPGSHDSGSYELNKSWDLSPDADPSLRNLSTIPVIGAMAKDITYRWAKCQSLSISQQLEAGVRYLDLRVAYRAATDEFHFVHSLYGPTVSSGVEQVKAFLAEHKKEVVLLDFNHFYSMELEQHLQLITYLIFVFEGMLCPYSALSSLTLNSLVEKGTRVVVFYQHSAVSEFPDLWPSHTIESPWSDTMDVGKCLQYQEKAAKERDIDRFHVCQAVLTPSFGEIMQKFASSLQVECAQKIDPQLPQWMRGDAMKACGGMVYIDDFVEEAGFLEAVIGLNE